MTAIAVILRRLWPYLAIVGLVALSLLLARRVGRAEALVRDYERRIERQREIREMEWEARNATDTDLVDSLTDDSGM